MCTGTAKLDNLDEWEECVGNLLSHSVHDGILELLIDVGRSSPARYRIPQPEIDGRSTRNLTDDHRFHVLRTDNGYILHQGVSK